MDDMSILIIHGKKKDLVAVRKSINFAGGPVTSNVIFHRGETNRWVPDLPDGYRVILMLLTQALHGPKISAMKRFWK